MSLTRPVCYVFLMPAMIKAAQKCGYALAIHGSMERDFDLVAVPWTVEAVSVEELVLALRASVGALRLEGWEDGAFKNPTMKPHGRMAWTLMLGGDWYVDLSVMPRKAGG